MKFKKLALLTAAAILAVGLALPSKAYAETTTVTLKAYSNGYEHGINGSWGVNGLANRGNPDMGTQQWDGRVTWIFGARFADVPQRSLLYFNISRHVPEGAVIDSAELRLFVHNNMGQTTSQELEILRITDPDGTGMWHQGTINPDVDLVTGDKVDDHERKLGDTPTFTIKDRRAGKNIPWTSADGSGVDDVLDKSSLIVWDWNYSRDRDWQTIDDPKIAEAVQIWADDPASNLGWFLATYDELPINYVTPDQEWYSDAGREDRPPLFDWTPELVITYSIPTGSATVEEAIEEAVEEAAEEAVEEVPVEETPDEEVAIVEIPAATTPSVNPPTGETNLIFIACGTLLAAVFAGLILKRKVKEER